MLASYGFKLAEMWNKGERRKDKVQIIEIDLRVVRTFYVHMPQILSVRQHEKTPSILRAKRRVTALFTS